jgi:DNA-binding phage protein
MSRRSERLLLARALVNISTSISRLRFLSEVMERRVSMLRERGMESIAEEIEVKRKILVRALAELESISERLRTLIELGTISGDLVGIASIVKDVRLAIKDLQPEIAASLGEAISYIEEALESSKG